MTLILVARVGTKQAGSEVTKTSKIQNAQHPTKKRIFTSASFELTSCYGSNETRRNHGRGIGTKVSVAAAAQFLCVSA